MSPAFDVNRIWEDRPHLVRMVRGVLELHVMTRNQFMRYNHSAERPAKIAKECFALCGCRVWRRHRQKQNRLCFRRIRPGGIDAAKTLTHEVRRCPVDDQRQRIRQRHDPLLPHKLFDLDYICLPP